MMRNVAIGAVLGFGVVVVMLTIFNGEAPPQAPPPSSEPPPVTTATALQPDSGVPMGELQPVGVGKVIHSPLMVRDRLTRDSSLRQMMLQHPIVLPIPDAG